MSHLLHSARLLAGAFATLLLLMVAFGLGACSKKPSADRSRPAEQMPKSDSKKMTNTLDKSAMKNDDSSIRLRVMERPGQHSGQSPDQRPDAGAVSSKANKGMIAQMKLVDPNE